MYKTTKSIYKKHELFANLVMTDMSKTTIPFCVYLSSNFNLKLVLGNKDKNDTN